MDAVEAAERHRPLARRHVGQALADDHSTTTGCRCSPRGSATARSSPSASRRVTPSSPSRRSARPWATSRRSSSSSARAGRCGSASAADRYQCPKRVGRDLLGRAGVGDVEAPHPRSPQLQAVGAGAGRRAEVGGDLADVGALRALDGDRRPLRAGVEPLDVQAVDRDAARRRGDGLAAAHAHVGALAVDLDRRGGGNGLDDLAAQGLGRRPHRARIDGGPGRRDLALRIERGRDRPELHHRGVALVDAREVGGQARRPAGDDQQQAGRERVERAGVAQLAAERRAQPAQDRERGRSRRLVDQVQAGDLGHRAGRYAADSASWALTSDTMNPRMSSTLPACEKPAACLCPPPAESRAIAETSISPRERSDTRLGARLAVGERHLLADEARHLHALDGAEMVDQPLGGGLVALDEREIVAAHVRDQQAAVAVGHGVVDHASQQLELAGLDALEHALEDLVHVDAGLDQARAQAQRRGARRAVLEAAGVGHQADVQGLGDRRGELDAQPVEDAHQDLGGRRGVAVDQVHGAEAAVVVVMVDVDDRRAVREQIGVLAAEAALVAAVEREQRPAFERGRIDVPLHAARVEEGDLVRDRRLRLEVGAHLPPQLPQRGGGGGHRADRIAVGVLVGRDQDAVCRSKSGDHGLQVGIECDVGHSGLGLDRRILFAAHQLLEPHRLVKSLIIVEGKLRSALEVELPRDP